MKFDRVTIEPKVCGGRACVRGLRFPVSRLLALLAAGETPESILEAYPYLEREDITQALQYAAHLAGGNAPTSGHGESTPPAWQ